MPAWSPSAWLKTQNKGKLCMRQAGCTVEAVLKYSLAAWDQCSRFPHLSSCANLNYLVGAQLGRKSLESTPVLFLLETAARLRALRAGLSQALSVVVCVVCVRCAWKHHHAGPQRIAACRLLPANVSARHPAKTSAKGRQIRHCLPECHVPRLRGARRRRPGNLWHWLPRGMRDA